ncbi:MAG: outer membrane protein OmpA-like peptidoglycan-associated protein [Crocinitomicaceae bacterium]|jgi:outer membrane protein OmpA-like peptidoglycan-associated protein
MKICLSGQLLKISRVLTLLFFFVFIVNYGLLGQFSYQKLTDAGKYDKVYKKALKEYVKNPSSVETVFDFAVLYNFPEFKSHNVDTAYFFAQQAYRYYGMLEQKDLDKLGKKGITSHALEKVKTDICLTAFTESQAIHSIEVYNHFISAFKDLPELTVKATDLRNTIAYKNACDVNTVKTLQQFIDKYPNSKEINLAKDKRNALAFSQAEEISTVASFQYFIDEYPKAKEIESAKDLRDALAYETARKENTVSAFDDFIHRYPQSRKITAAYYERDRLFYLETIIPGSPSSHVNFLKNNPENKYENTITDSLYSISVRRDDFYGLRYLTKNARSKSLQDSAWFHYYKNYTQSGASNIISSFDNAHSYDFPYEKLLEKERANAFNGEVILRKNRIKLSDPDLRKYIRSSPDKDLGYLMVLKIIEPSLKRKNWKEALRMVNELQLEFDGRNKKMNDLIELLSTSDRNIKTEKLNRNVNTVKGREYVPVISADNAYLYFCGRDRSDNYYGEDIYVSKYRNGTWQKAELLMDLCTYENDAPLSVSTDGNTMFLFKNGDLFYSEKEFDGWGSLEEFPYPINSDDWDADAMMTSDGKGLLFTSERSCDHPEIGGMDIFICLKEEDGWSDPINLGSTINTPYRDRMAYLHPDMKTMYFSSEGHGGLGGLDVFKTTRLCDSTWTDWSEPINLGREINTYDEDWGYKISTDGKKAYYARIGSNEYSDIHVLDLPNYLRPGFVATVSGKLVDIDNNPISATIKWEDLETGKAIGESKSDPEDGSYFIVLPLGKIYGYYIENGDYYPISNNIDLRTEETSIEVEEDIEIISFDQMINDGRAVPINNLFFATNRSTLLAESKPELKRVAKIIKIHYLNVEISGHTDNVGTEEHNQLLSEQRAESVKAFLISLDVPSELVHTIGYGESKPAESNETETGKAKNRRVELKFIE